MLNYITLREAAGILPGAPSVCTLWRWCRQGLRVRGTDRVAWLKHVYIGRRLYTSSEWLQEFLDELAAPTASTCPATVTLRWGNRSPDRRRQIAEAERILEEAGI